MRLALLSADALSCRTAISDPQLPLVTHCDPTILHGLHRASNTAYAFANAGPGTAHCNTNHQGGKNSVCSCLAQSKHCRIRMAWHTG